MINDDQGALNAELSKLTQASLIEAARVGDEEGVRLNGHVLYLLSTQGGSSTDTAKAETVTPLDEGKSGGGKQVSMTVKKAKVRKTKVKKVSKRGAHVVGNGVTLTTHLFRVWLGCQALLNAKAELVSRQPVDEGFTLNGCSAVFVATFMGREVWSPVAVRSVSAAMTALKNKGLLVWVAKELPGKSGRSVRGNFGFGPKA